MPINTGVLTSNKTADGDECFTPYYAVEPLLEFIPKGETIWCPFDLEWSAFVQTFKQGGATLLEVIYPKGKTFSAMNPNTGT